MDHSTSPAALFDDLAAHYDDDLFHHGVAQALVAGLPQDPPAGTVLDVATGTGAAAFAALRHLRPQRVVGVDLSGRMIDRALAQAATLDPGQRIQWRVGPAVPAPVGRASVDVVLCASSLHFLGLAAVRDWLRVLRPGGRAAFTLPPAATFRPSGVFADLVAADLTIPADEQQAAAVATEAGFVDAVARRLDVAGERPKSVFLVYATAPPAGGAHRAEAE
ncbi:class I SAM-dependent methyltransferase [Goodfellowiella coeruleoviolacea]|uniref:class I SAM-dependent methyltransferase n=1 Tax=Goodfellowiella coeruleoviolacea TaxID=334858 RepID=UPI0020A49920|nr:class I SAM-dependent methyltransferase [Goodfellowiella coeruleoviolacea]